MYVKKKININEKNPGIKMISISKSLRDVC